jgi:ferric-dicitrate binding protein FerR (iron transport regulator)
VENIDDLVALLLRDDRLIHWVLSPDVESIAFWEQWMKDNPEKVPALFKARGIVHDLAYAERPEDAGEFAETIWSGIGAALQDPSTTSGRKRRRPRTAIWLAASLTGVLLVGGAIAWWLRQDNRAPQPEQKVANLLVRQDLDRVNQTDRSQIVYLVDGSKVILQPGSGIRYAAFLQKDKREVYLQGNAFFEVAKDAHRPFYVYSGDLEVRVLGTSFDMNTNRSSGEIMILVRTGSISVSTTNHSASATMKAPVILTQNQKLVYKRQSPDWAPVPVNSQELSTEKMPAARPISFDFDETPVVKVFQTLENAYGIPIHYDASVFSGCSITSDLTDETFEEKLKIICSAICVNYRIDEDGVLIEGKPCKPTN